MEKASYTTKKGVTQFRPVMTEREYKNLTRNENPGFCLACGAEADGCEPDARGYECEICSAKKVYGLEELLMMGLLTFSK